MESEDKALHTSLMKLLSEGTFDLKGKSVPGFLKVYGWCQELPKRLAKPEPKEEAKPAPKPKKKTGASKNG